MDPLSKIEEIVKRELSSSSHDLEHTFRVLKLALKIAKTEPLCNIDVLKLSAILHDIARVKEDTDNSRRIDHAILGAEMAAKILKELSFDDRTIESVKHCIRAHRFRGSERPETLEAKILSDADKIDAIGAIGVARAFMIAGEWGEPLYMDFEGEEKYLNNTENGRIKNQKNHSPNIEFEVKLKHIPERLYTDEAKRIAQERVRFMELFFERLSKELKGEP